MNGAPTSKVFFTLSVGQLVAGFQLNPCGEDEVLQGDTVRLGYLVFMKNINSSTADIIMK